MQSRVKNVLSEEPYRKTKIPLALREQVWIRKMGHRFDGKCRVSWCRNRISVFDFQSGHNVPESRGGKTDLDNLIPICSRCNNSMGDRYTIDEWNEKFATAQPKWAAWFRGLRW
jgi:5-methylcytosine-specific restriction endonuclease McrA